MKKLLQKRIDNMASTTHPPRYALTILTTSLVTPSVWTRTHLTHQYLAANVQMTTAPQVTTSNFSEGVETEFSGAKVTGPKSESIKTLPAKQNEQDQKQLIVPLTDSLKPGIYTADWHAVSVDGHKTKGHYTFSMK